MIQLRPKQQEGFDAIRNSFRRNHAVLFVGPTGFGKTILFSAIAAAASAKGSRIGIMAHRHELLKQISGALSGFNVPHGLISPRFTPDYRQPVQVISVPTMGARHRKILPQYKKFDLLINDETHHLTKDNTFGSVYEMLGAPKLLGVTATPCRGDGKGLGVNAGGYFQDMIEVTNTRELIDDGFLSDFTVYAPPTQIDLSGLKSRAGDWEREALSSRMDKPSITGDAVKHYSQICPGVPAVVFCVSIQHAEHVAEQFRAAGWNFQVVSGSPMADSVRDQRIAGLADGSIHGLCSADLISEGTDIPAITCAIFLRPTKSQGLYLQQGGRALRPVYAKGFDLSTPAGRHAAMAAGPKPKAIFLDHVGHCLNPHLGMIDDVREWSLDGVIKRKKKKEDEEDIKLRLCKSCFAVFDPAPVCPVRGAPVPTASPRKIEQVDGDLKEITRQAAAVIQQARRKEIAMARTMDDLERIAKERNYKPGWARAVYASRKQPHYQQRH